MNVIYYKKGSRDKDGVPQYHANFNLANSNFRFQIRQFFFCYSCFAFTFDDKQQKEQLQQPSSKRNDNKTKTSDRKRIFITHSQFL